MSEPTEACVLCQKPTKSRCSGCRSVSYCSKEHQKEDWRNHKKNCRAYEIQFFPESHQHKVVAKRNVKKDKVIVVEIPLVIGPRYLIDDEICPGCHRELNPRNNFHCPRCGWLICSPSCPGLTAPTRHGAECTVLSKIKSKLFDRPNQVILPLRCLLLQKTDPNKWKEFLDLAASAVKLTTSRGSTESTIILQEMILKPLLKFAPEMLSDCSEETVEKIYDVLEVYGFHMKDPDLGPLVAVSSVTSLMNHSCVPNTRRFLEMAPVDTLQPDETKLRYRVVVRAATDILRGESISMVYMDIWMCTWARQVTLMTRRKVHCSCARCLDPRELGTDFGTLKCTKERCTGWVLPINTHQIDTTDWKCETCNQIYPSEKVMALLLSLKKEMEACRVREDQRVANREAMLERLQKFLHPNHHYCVLIKEQLLGLYAIPRDFLTFRFEGDAQLTRAAELCRDILRIMMDPGILEDEGKISETLVKFSIINTEIAKRKKASGAWTGAQADYVLAECQDIIRRAMRIKRNCSPVEANHVDEDLSFELIKKMADFTLTG